MEARFEDRDERLSLYDRLGGRLFTSLIAEKFCDRLMADARLSELLRDVQPDEFRTKVTETACTFLGHDRSFVARELSELGGRIAFTESHFNRCISHLIAALVWAGVTRELIEELIEVVTPLSAHLVQAKS
jgi:truncated hemoglobin YjbI